MSEATPPNPVAVGDPLAAGRAALAAHRWPEAFDRLSEADRAGHLTADDLETLSTAAFFAARSEAGLEAKERAFKAHEAAGNELRAAYVALDIARNYGLRGKHSIASAWTSRAERIIGPEGETYAHGYLALVRSEVAGATGDIDSALRLAERAVEIGNRAADADLRAYAMTNLGTLKIATGATVDGFALMEEAAIAGVNGELTPLTTGVTTCQMIGACRDLTDYRRASEWIEATEKYCDRESLSGFPGVCRIHRAEVAAVGGGWDRAVVELERATVELGAFNATSPQADGFYAIGDIRRLKGDFAGAQEALREAHARGRTPHPALALIRLAEGNVKGAASAINTALAEETWDRWARARLLPAQVEIAIAAGDLATARTAVDELGATISGYPSPAFEAGRRVALARVLIAEGDVAGATHELRSAIKGWRDLGSPYEVARARAILSRALRAGEDAEGADLELNAALDTFRELGARIDVTSAERELQEATERRTGPITATRTFIFTDIVGSTNLAEMLGDRAWETLLRKHDDLIRSQVASARGEVVNSTGDGFFVAFETARQAVDCAIAIQRALREQRESAGFALSLRIGIHSADANRRGSDYSGMGVHVAARVAALAGGGEILASAETIAQAGDVASSESRSVAVKGVSAPVTVAAIVWS
ncbi:MAG TPA: adenylate/guanylate cyclase domain-containing protein [Verrucomicrobiae bacterium]|nr:adenylate/guanylate cyclase domain-containing protein [Verrucomicrobiae bacterium]